MDQLFNIIRIETSMDMGVGNRSKRWTRILAEDLMAGNVFDIDDHELTVMDIDENEMNKNSAIFTLKEIYERLKEIYPQ